MVFGKTLFQESSRGPSSSFNPNSGLALRDLAVQRMED